MKKRPSRSLLGELAKDGSSGEGRGSQRNARADNESLQGDAGNGIVGDGHNGGARGGQRTESSPGNSTRGDGNGSGEEGERGGRQVDDRREEGQNFRPGSFDENQDVGVFGGKGQKRLELTQADASLLGLAKETRRGNLAEQPLALNLGQELLHGDVVPDLVNLTRERVQLRKCESSLLLWNERAGKGAQKCCSGRNERERTATQVAAAAVATARMGTRGRGKRRAAVRRQRFSCGWEAKNVLLFSEVTLLTGNQYGELGHGRKFKQG